MCAWCAVMWAPQFRKALWCVRKGKLAFSLYVERAASIKGVVADYQTASCSLEVNIFVCLFVYLDMNQSESDHPGVCVFACEGPEVHLQIILVTCLMRSWLKLLSWIHVWISIIVDSSLGPLCGSIVSESLRWRCLGSLT